MSDSDIKPTFELIMGPMFSGKTTMLIKRYNEIIKTTPKDKCLALNYALDERYGTNKIITHDGLSIDCYNIYDIGDFIEDVKTQPIFLNASYIFINEGQFFKNLINYVIFILEVFKKNIIICGLDYDYKREKFGDILDLTHYASTCNYLTGKCNTKDCPMPSTCSHRIVQNNEQILIGSCEYIPLCIKCYEKENIQ